MPQVKIGPFIVGDGREPFIVAEAGINHNGELEKAFEMIKVAKEAGADAIKFQTFKAVEFITDTSLTYTYKSQDKEITEPMLTMFERYQFSTCQWQAIKEECQAQDILFLSTPQNRSDLDLLLELGIPAIKIGSDDFNNLPLIRSYSETGIPIVLSCGMADLGEVHQSLEAVGALHGYPSVLLLCTSQYPTPSQDVNILKLQTLRDTFPMVPVGFSDHTQGETASILAVGMGASFFEKHFTLDNNLPGPDHWFSENPMSLKKWVRSIRDAFIMLGKKAVEPTESEKQMRKIARRSVIALREIERGETLTSENIGLRRPGTGLAPSYYNKILGLKASKSIAKGKMIELGDFER